MKFKRIISYIVPALLVPVGYLFLVFTRDGFRSGHLTVESE